MQYKKVSEILDSAFVPDADNYITHLREMISCRTISDEEYFNKNEFEKFDKTLEKNYPHVFASAEKIELHLSTFLRIKGKEHHSPLVLMSHKDVVYEGKKKWKALPYAGTVIKGKMYGRGTFDCKGSLCTIFEALEGLLSEGYEFSSDIYIFASASEETGGDDAPEAVEYFRKNGIVPGLVIDEGGAVLRNPFPSPYKRFAMIGAVERSSSVMIFDTDSERNAKSFVKKIKAMRPGEYAMYPDVSGLLHGLSEYLSAPLGSILKLLDRHHNAATFILTHCGAEARSFCGALSNAAVQDANTAEKKFGAVKNPVRVSVSGNFYNKIDKLSAEAKKIAADFGMELINEKTRETEPPVSPSSSGWKFVSDVAEKVFENIGVLPYPVMGRTDSRYFIGYAEDVIRFIPVEISLSQMMKFHCPNENIFTSSLSGAVAFYREAIKQYNN